MSSTIFWLVVLCLVGAVILHGILLRAFYQRSLQALRFKHHQVLSRMHGELEQRTLRLLQLQREQDSVNSAAVRLQSAVRKSEGTAMSARQALECELDDDLDARYAPATDGFADTEVLAHDAQPSSLLLQ